MKKEKTALLWNLASPRSFTEKEQAADVSSGCVRCLLYTNKGHAASWKIQEARVK